MYTERAKKAMPPQKSLRFVRSGVVEGSAICGGWEGGCGGEGGDEAFCSSFGVSCAFDSGALVSDLEPELQPKRETIVGDNSKTGVQACAELKFA
jgi:hypothetical protein